jgi:RHS repeat-associated protein
MSARQLPPSPARNAQPHRSRPGRLGLRAGLVAGALLVAGLCFVLWDPAGILRPPAASDQPAGDRRTRQGGSVDRSAASLGWEFAYDEAGRTTGIVDPAGQVTRIRYELDAQKQVRRQWLDRPDHTQVVFDFDLRGRRTRMTDPAGNTAYEYDRHDRPTVVRRGDGPAVRYTYDTLGRVTSMRVGPRWQVGYAYDFQGRVIRIDTPAGSITYQYLTGSRQIVRKLPSGLRTLSQYNRTGTVDFIEHSSADHQLLARFTYHYRPDGLMDQATEWSPQGEKTMTYEYDPAQRLTAVTDSRLGRTTYRYDSFGNRIETAAPGRRPVAGTHDWFGRLVRLGGVPCAHEEAGNLTEYPAGKGRMKLTHTATGQVATAACAQSQVAYRYDGDGNLIGRTVDAATTAYLPDPTADEWRPLLADDHGRQTFYVWDGDTLLAAFAGEDVQFFLHNHQGSIRGVTDRAGQVVERCDYDAFGTPRQPAPAPALRPAFAGMFYDSRANLYLTRARAYDPALGRFLQPDPYHPIPDASPEALAVFAYCGDDPVNYVDRNGCARKVCVFADNYGVGPYDQFKKQFRDPSIYARDTQTGQWVPAQLHHGHMQSWAQSRFQGYDPNKAPTLTLTATDHYKVNTEFNRWKAQQGMRPNESVDWSRFSRRDIEQLNKRLFDAAGVPAAARKEYYGEFGRYVQSLNNNGTTPAGPTRVGGVSLRGAGEALRDLGPLRGVALDSHGRLVLLAQDGRDLGLPPLRLDDVVTVFRSAYERGEAPFVSIDPDAKDPHGPIMNVRHSPGTADTYVGWVLFEADRMMKAYSLGTDNVTRSSVRSGVAGYGETLDANFNDDPAGPADGSRWQRFWLVPARVRRLESTDRRLTLLDVPIMIRTEAMVLSDGKLVPAPDGKSSPGARAFQEWFSRNYPAIAREARSRFPAECAAKTDVMIFEELKRIALIAAVAERLRDQGVPMPAWMRHYHVQPFPVPRTTPAITARLQRLEDGRTRTLNTYGGATLSPPDRVVQTVKAAPQADALQPALNKAVETVPTLTPVAFTHGGQRYRAVALPGDDTLEVGACRLDETDLSVTVEGGALLDLTRHFHSFFESAGELGTAWTFDLPRLEKVVRPASRADKEVRFKPTAHRLTSPLSTWGATFAEIKPVPEVNGNLAVPEQPGPFLGLGGSTDLGFATHVLIFRDGQRWHFDAQGNLAARVQGPVTILYQRSAAGRLLAVVGLYAGQKRAEIRLRYDDQGRVVAARASNGQEVQYRHDTSGRLAQARTARTVWDYRYQAGLVAEVSRNGRLVHRFTYTPHGRLESERRADGRRLVYQVAAGPEGVQITAASGNAASSVVAAYDAQLRPVHRVLPDGTELHWRYDNQGVARVEAFLPGGGRLLVRRSSDGREEDWTLPEGGSYRLCHDEAGREAELLEDGRPLVQRKWHRSGQLATVRYESVALHPENGPQGQVTGVLITGPEQGGKFTSWLRVVYDDQGRAVRVTDGTGSVITVGYDGQGQATTWTAGTDQLQARRDARGRVQLLEGSWGYREERVYDGGDENPRQIIITQGGRRQVMEYHRGKLVKVCTMGGGELDVSYYDQGPARGQIRAVRGPSGVVLSYEYDATGRLMAVHCEGRYRMEFKYDARGRLTGQRQVPVQA